MLRFKTPCLAITLALLAAGTALAGDGQWTSTYPGGGHFPGQGLTLDTATGRLDAIPNWRSLYSSTDGAATWTNVLDAQIHLDFDRTDVAAILRGLDGTLYVIARPWNSGERVIYESSDDGASWTRADFGLTGDLAVLALDQSAAATLYAGNRQGALFKTIDGAASWALTGAGLPAAEIRSIEVDPSIAATVYVGVDGSGLFKSTDGGASFTNVDNNVVFGRVDDVAIDFTNPLTVYAADSSDHTIAKSTDGGVSWTKLAPAFNFDGAVQTLLALDPGNPAVLYAAAGNEVWKSLDGGLNWSPALVTPFAQVRVVLVDSVVTSTLYAATAGEGVFKSEDGGATWSAANGGLLARNFNHSKAKSVHFDASTPGLVYTGGESFGWQSSDGGTTWTRMNLPVQTAGTFATHPADPGGVWMVMHDLWRSTDSGATWSDGSGGAFCCFGEGDVVIDPANPDTVYAATTSDGIWKSTDRGATWNLANNGLGTTEIRLLEIDPNDGNVLYAGSVEYSSPRGIWKSTDGAASWFQLGGGLPEPLNLHRILVHPADSNTVWVGSATENGGVYKSTDGGDSWSKLLDANVNAIASDPGNPGHLYVGTWNNDQRGFYRTLDGGVNWALLNEGLPIAPGVESMTVDPANPARVLIGTTGGVWEYTFAGTPTLTVDNHADSGPGSLRDALVQADQDGLPTRVTFAPSLDGSTLVPHSPLPPLTEGETTLDGDLDDDCAPDVALAGWQAGEDGLRIHSANNVIRGLAIQNFPWNGLLISSDAGPIASGNLVVCSHFGVDLSGQGAAGNGIAGVHLRNQATGNQIGTPAEPNVIGDNFFGLHVIGVAGNVIAGNLIGVGADGMTPLPNHGPGVALQDDGTLGTTDHTVGPGNVIAWNQGPGVEVLDAASVGNTITENSIFANDHLGILLGGCCPKPNDPGDVDVGPNTLLNSPELQSSSADGGDLFTIGGTAPDGATVEIFAAAPDPTGYGEGEIYLDSTTATGGVFSLQVTLPLERQAVTATATDALGNTSEFSQNLTVKYPDEVHLESGEGFQGDTVEIPVFVRDLASTRLGSDQPAGNRIQGFTFDVQFQPGASVQAASAHHSGITAALTPLFDTFVTTPDSLTYVVSFDETTDPVPLVLDAAAPGDEVARLVLTIDPSAPPTPIHLTLRPSTTLSNQAGTSTETGGDLGLFGGSLNVRTRGATALFATVLSASEIRLRFNDPQAGETGFRVERSDDGGGTFFPVATLGPDDTEWIDTTLLGGTLYYYRVVAFSGGGDAPSSNLAFGETHPNVAAKVCLRQLSPDHSWMRFPSPAHNGSTWANAFYERAHSTNDEVYLQFHDASGNPIGPWVPLSETDSLSRFPTLRWNGQHFGVWWTEHMRDGAGHITSNDFFALLDADGRVLRKKVRLFDQVHLGGLNSDLQWAFDWDGAGWGFVDNDFFDPPSVNVAFWRFDESGELLSGPARLSFANGEEGDSSLAWSGSHYGTAWIRHDGAIHEVLFRRVLPDGTSPDPAPITVWQAPMGERARYTSLVWNGSGWAVAWGRIDPDGDLLVHLRLLAADGTPLGNAERLSDDEDPAFGPGSGLDPYDDLPELVFLPNGAYAVYTSSFSYAQGAFEIARLEADVNGLRVGARRFLSEDDGANSAFHNVATSGNQHLVLYNENRQGSQETGGLLVSAGGTLLSGPNDHSCCHSPGNSRSFVASSPTAVEPLLDGFLGVWNDIESGAWQLNATYFDNAGHPFATWRPLSGRDVRGQAGVEALANHFAFAFKDGAGTAVWNLYDVFGGSIFGDVEVAHDAGGRGDVDLAFSGEVWGVVYFNGNSVELQRVDPGGGLVGGPAMIADNALHNVQVQWTGEGFAVMWRGQDRALHFALVDPWGNLINGPSPVTANPTARRDFHFSWTGDFFGLVWLEDRGSGPEGDEIYFNLLDPSGNPTLTDVLVLDPVWSPGPPFLYWAGDRFRLVRGNGANGSFDEDGLHQDEILPDGTVITDVGQLTNRGQPGAIGWNGVTLGLAWNQLHETFFETDVCLADATPPPCPDLSIAQSDDAVELDWNSVDDPESTIWRYNLYRDGFMLAELFSSTGHYSDAGYRPGAIHQYELRALNGAFAESPGCPVSTFSTLTGDGNGDGTVDVADVFYLILYLFAGGSPPQGDADANGDGVIDAADVFYLVNHLFGGGPPPLAAPAGATRREPAAAADVLGLGRVNGVAGAVVDVPVYVRDVSGTPLDEAGEGIQGFALRVDFDPSMVIAAEFVQAGLTASKTALFPIIQKAADSLTVLLSFAAPDQALDFTPDAAAPGDLIGRLRLELAADLPRGIEIPLSLDSGSALVSGDAMAVETPARGTLTLVDGAIVVSETPLFADGFERGDPAAWSLVVGEMGAIFRDGFEAGDTSSWSGFG